MRAERHPDGITIEASGYGLSLPDHGAFAALTDPAGDRWADLCLAWSVHALGGLDETVHIGEAALEPVPGGWRVTIPATSSVWAQKRLVVECRETELLAHVEVEGSGRLTELHLFGGYHSGDPGYGSGFFHSRAGFRSLFSPEPVDHERRVNRATESAMIDVLGGPLPGQGHWFFTPPPFCYCVSRQPPPDDGALPAGPWLAFGLCPRPGAYGFTGFAYHAVESIEQAFSFRLDYEAQTAVDGHFESPRLVLSMGAGDPYYALERYAALLAELGLVRGAAPAERPDWWTRPIFCGWGAQCALAQREPACWAPDLCRQELYDGFLAALEARAVVPGTVVIDDKWQRAYGLNEVDDERWPDLRGWIARRHASGGRVLLWLKAWDPEGLPADECVTNAAAEGVAADPSNPAYEARLRSQVRRMLDPAGYGADGFKVDFTARTPSGPGLRRHGREWGVELLRRLLWIIHDEAKLVKPDALVVTNTPNAYFAEVSDMIRLNDVNTASPVVPQMRHRARVVRATLPGVPIDTDDSPMADRAAWRDYLRAKPELGVPALYYATHIWRSGEPLRDEDYAAIREAWTRTC